MNRILIPAAIAALVAGCSMPGIFGQQSNEPALADSAQTVVVREIYHETPVYYVDTVYMTEEPAPVQPVYVENEYNEYNETNVYVHKQVVLPPSPPYRPERGWSRGDHERRPADRRRDDGSRRDRNKPGGSDQPGEAKPQHPVKKINAPAGNDWQKAPVPPTAPAKPTPPQRQSLGGSVQVTKLQGEVPKQAPAPSVDKPVAPASDVVQVGMVQARRK
jgi:hypothetical protein